MLHRFIVHWATAGVDLRPRPGLGQKTDLYVGMHHPPHPQVDAEFETSVLGNQIGDGYRDRAGSISHRHALQVPEEREQVVGERRLAEFNVQYRRSD